MECWRHVFEDEACDPVHPRGLVALGRAEGLLQCNHDDMSGDHRDGDRR